MFVTFRMFLHLYVAWNCLQDAFIVVTLETHATNLGCIESKLTKAVNFSGVFSRC